MKRRDFLKATLGGGAAALAGATTTVQARENLKPIEGAVGLLYDSTLCVGCKACVKACKEVNGMPPEIRDGNPQYDSARDLSAKTRNVIKVYKNGTAEVKDREIDGFAFAKRSCQHCVDPGCVSVCPVSALTKDPKTGIVGYDADACIGCRTCMTGCPYNVPRFDYEGPFGKLFKCELCNQKGLERVDKGLTPACAEVCPTGATLFGRQDDLLQEAKHRLALPEGEMVSYPRGNLSKPDAPHEKPAPKYQSNVFGEKELGGTQVMHIAGVPTEKLGLPNFPERSYASISEGVQHTIYKGFAAPLLALAGMTYLVRRNTKNGDDQDGGES